MRLAGDVLMAAGAREWRGAVAGRVDVKAVKAGRPDRDLDAHAQHPVGPSLKRTVQIALPLVSRSAVTALPWRAGAVGVGAAIAGAVGPGGTGRRATGRAFRIAGSAAGGRERADAGERFGEGVAPGRAGRCK